MEHSSSARRYRRFFGADPRRDVDEELAFHFDMRVDEFRRAGMSDDEAREAAMQRFGDVREIHAEVEDLAVKRHARRYRGQTLDTLRQDIRFAVRTLVANPGYAVVVALTLALGIGANAAVFSVAYGVLLRPLPYKNANELVRIWSRNDRRNVPYFSVSLDDYLDWKTESRAFTAVAAYDRQRDATLGAGDRPEMVSIAALMPDVFSVLGTPALIGRTLGDADARPTSANVVVISHALWTTSFGGDRTIVGRDVAIDGKRYTVVGVMPPRFEIPGSGASLWVPLSVDQLPRTRGDRLLRVVGRLAPHATVVSALAELNTIAERAARTFPTSNADWRVSIVPLPEALLGVESKFGRAVVTLLGVVALVLLIACANAANLQLARAAVREREIAVRTALGASRARITMQLLTESVILAVIGGAIGLALAYGGVRLLRTAATATIPRLQDVKLDAPVLLFTTVVALGTGILFGLVPALRISRGDPSEMLKHGSRTPGSSTVKSHVRGALVIAEIALSLMLLIGAGLLMRSFAHLQGVDLGFDEQSLMVARMRLPEATYPTPVSMATYFANALATVRATGSVESVALVSSAPFGGVNPGLAFLRLEDPIPTNNRAPDADYRVISPGYLQTMRIHLVRGRDFTPDDRSGAPSVALVSATMAKMHWPNGDPIGHQIRVGDVAQGPVFTIVGVVDDVRYQSVETHVIRPMIYFSWLASPQRAMAIVARSKVTSAETVVRDAIATVDRRLPAPAVTPMSDLVGEVVATRRFTVLLFGVFAGIALTLAVVGLYGVLSYLVRQRAHELGVRVALGAPTTALLRLVVVGALRLTVAGVALGLAASYLFAGVMKSLLFAVSPTDGLTFGVLALLLTIVAIAASLGPAWRATRSDPMRALRGL